MNLQRTAFPAADVGHKLLAPYVTGGITADWTDYLLAYQAAGADAVEIGLPFSDPMLDGAVIQQASDRALARGVTVESILADVSAVRAAVHLPLVAMTYTNLLVRRGYAQACAALVAAGFSGLIVPDLPVDECDELAEAAAAAGLDLTLLAAPATRPDRLARICARSRGFIYAVSVMGTTGERAELAASARVLVGRLKGMTELPVLLGFGIAGREQAVEAAEFADGVIVGAALMRKVLDGASPAQLGALVGEVRAGLDQ
jgi:tryptophan synthase alpha chain